MPVTMDINSRLRSLTCGFTRQELLVVGIGNTLCGDDAAGPLVCQGLKAFAPDRVIDAGAVPENHIGRIVRQAPRLLLVVDAVHLGETPGTIQVLPSEGIRSPTIGTHAVSLRFLVDMIRCEISCDVFLVAIQPANMRLNEPLSESVSRAVATLTEVLAPILR